ncbi:MAG: hypothetical protein CVU26_03740 [Betaproteobacteria bacterium HGW-Betaproteobacteria-2]|nr:MAG: hypothetical protein CVU26_03740 [Betaproteobacteria bacterium HGW-Betaproteobacteria-2]
MKSKSHKFEPSHEILDVLPGYIYQLIDEPTLPMAETLQDTNRLLPPIHPDDYDRVLSKSIATGKVE